MIEWRSARAIVVWWARLADGHAWQSSRARFLAAAALLGSSALWTACGNDVGESSREPDVNAVARIARIALLPDSAYTDSVLRAVAKATGATALSSNRELSMLGDYTLRIQQLFGEGTGEARALEVRVEDVWRGRDGLTVRARAVVLGGLDAAVVLLTQCDSARELFATRSPRARTAGPLFARYVISLDIDSVRPVLLPNVPRLELTMEDRSGDASPRRESVVFGRCRQLLRLQSPVP